MTLIVEDRAHGFRKINFVPVAGNEESFFPIGVEWPKKDPLQHKGASCSYVKRITFRSRS